MDIVNWSNLISLGVIALFAGFLWWKMKESKSDDTGTGGGGGDGPVPVVNKGIFKYINYITVLFDNPVKMVIAIVIFVLMMFTLFAIPSRGAEASELYVDGGAAVVRGESPTLGLTITYPRMGPVNTDYELGFNLIGQSDNRQHNPNQFVVHGMLVDGYKNFEMGMGFGYFNVPSEYNCQFTYSLLGRWRFNDRFHVQWHHFSTAGSCKPNPGRDLLTVGYRF